MRILIVMLICLYAFPALAYSQCPNAVRKYNMAIEALSTDMQRYSSCIADSRGKNDCSVEFHALISSHDAFADAVQAVQVYCR